MKNWSTKIDRASKAITDFVSNVKKQALLTQQMKLGQGAIDSNYTAAKIYDQYMYDSSLPGEWKDKIRNGQYNIEDLDTSTDEGKELQEQIQEYQDWYDKMQACYDTIQDLTNEQTELFNEKLQSQIDVANEKLERHNSIAENISKAYDLLSQNGTKWLKEILKDIPGVNKVIQNFGETFNSVKDKTDPSSMVEFANKGVDQDVKNKKTARNKARGKLETSNRALNNASSALKSAEKERDKAAKKVKKFGLTKEEKNRVASGKVLSLEGIDPRSPEYVARQNYNKSVNKVNTKKSNKNATVKTKREAQDAYNAANLEYGEAFANASATKLGNISSIYGAKHTLNQNKLSHMTANITDTKKTTASDYSNIIKVSEREAELAEEEADLFRETIEREKKAGKLTGQALTDAYAELETKEQAVLDAVEAAKNYKIDQASVELNKLNHKSSDNQAAKNTIQNDLNIREALGLSSTKADHEAMIKNEQSEIDIQKGRIEQLKNLSGMVEVGSEKWHEYQNEIVAANEAIQNSNLSIVEHQNEIANLPLEKLQEELDLLDSIGNKINSEIELKQSKGEDLSEEDYLNQIRNNDEQIETLTNTLHANYQNYQKAFADPAGAFGGKTADEWLQDMNSVEAEINGLKADNEQLKDSLRDDVYWRDFERAHEAADRMKNTISGLSGLISDDMMYDADGKVTDFGVAQMALITKNYETARDEVQNYTNDIDNLNKQFNEGKYSPEEYAAKLNELQSGLLSSSADMKEFSDTMVNMYQQMAQAELNQLFELIDARNEALRAKKEYYDYDKTLRSKTEDLRTLEAQRAALEGIDSAEAKMKRAELDAQIKEANDELNDTIMEHQLQLSQDALSGLKETLQETFDDKWANVHSDLSQVAEILAAGNELTSSSANTINETLNALLAHFGADPNYMKIGDTPSFARGTKHNLKDQMAWVSEHQNTEMIIRKADKAILTPTLKGDAIAPANLTENLFKWGEITPLEFTENLIPRVPLTNAQPSSINQNFGSLINVEGNVDSTVVTDLKKFAHQFYEGAYQHTIRQIQMDAQKNGLKVRH